MIIGIPVEAPKEKPTGFTEEDFKEGHWSEPMYKESVERKTVWRRNMRKRFENET